MTDEGEGAPASAGEGTDRATDGGVDGVQSTLGEGDIAEELAADQRQISIAEFFEKNKHMLGFDSEARALITAVKEAVDNALDAAEEAGFRPNIQVEIKESGDYYRVIVEDNGPGVTKEQIPNVFGKLLYGSRFHKREQNRGQQGIGISAAVLYSQLTSGQPVKITSKTPRSDKANYFELIIDTDTNEPEISVEETKAWGRTRGTRIELEMEANMRARKRLHEYIEHTAVVNPHATIKLVEPEETLQYEYITDQLPEKTEEIRPHPHGIELGTLIKMLDATSSHSISGFLQNEFTRVGKLSAEEIIDSFRDRHYGREMAWRLQSVHTADLGETIRGAVANKPSDAVEAFSDIVVNGGDYVDDDDEHVDGLNERDRIAHHGLVDLVAKASEITEDEFDTTFGSTVQTNVVEAVWEAIVEGRTADLYSLLDEATSSNKDDETIQGLADRLASKFENAEDTRDRASRELLRDYIDRSADMTSERLDVAVGETARENILETLWEVMSTVSDDPPKVREVVNDRDTASTLLAAMRETDIVSPPTDCLSPITDELIEEGMKRAFDADFYSAETRDAEVYGGDPFIVEAGIAYGGEIDPEGQANLMRFANRVPLVYQQGACAITDVVQQINWRNYNLDQPGGSGMPAGPAVIVVHVASTNVPFTSESKDAVANIPEIEKEIELAVREAARDLKSHLNKRRSLQKRREKQSVIADILPKMAEKVAAVTGRETPDVDTSLARIMNNVLVSRTAENGAVELVIENNTDAGVDLNVTEMVSAEPRDLSAGTAVDMDEEWFIKWSPTVGAGESATLTYGVDGDPSFDVNVDGVESEKLTVEE